MTSSSNSYSEDPFNPTPTPSPSYTTVISFDPSISFITETTMTSSFIQSSEDPFSPTPTLSSSSMSVTPFDPPISFITETMMTSSFIQSSEDLFTPNPTMSISFTTETTRPITDNAIEDPVTPTPTMSDANQNYPITFTFTTESSSSQTFTYPIDGTTAIYLTPIITPTPTPDLFGYAKAAIPVKDESDRFWMDEYEHEMNPELYDMFYDENIKWQDISR